MKSNGYLQFCIYTNYTTIKHNNFCVVTWHCGFLFQNRTHRRNRWMVEAL